MSGKSKISWTEKVPMLRIHPETASISDIIHFVDDLIEKNQKLWAIKRYAEICYEDNKKCSPLTILEIIWPEDLRIQEQI